MHECWHEGNILKSMEQTLKPMHKHYKEGNILKSIQPILKPMHEHLNRFSNLSIMSLIDILLIVFSYAFQVNSFMEHNYKIISKLTK
jgi:hypothetical protein